MSIEETLQFDLTAAMRAKDAKTIACIRQVRAKAQEAQNAKDFDGKSDDAFYRGVLMSYCKQLNKGADELRKAGGRGIALADAYASEVNYLSRYLPKTLSREEAEPKVKALLESLKLTGPKDMGRAMGQVLKEYKDDVSPALARELVGAFLTRLGASAS